MAGPPRLMTVTITTSRKEQGAWIRDICAVTAQKTLRLDAPHQVVVRNAFSFVDLPEPATTVEFHYSPGFTDGADYNDGPGDVEGEIIAAIKKAFELETVFVSYSKADYRCY